MELVGVEEVECRWTGLDKVRGKWSRRRGAWKDEKGKRGGHTMTEVTMEALSTV